MGKTDYKKLIMERELVKLDTTSKLKHGQLIGFKGLGTDEITAAYPVWVQIGNEIQFVLYGIEKGKPCIDNTWIQPGNEIYTNVDRIIVEMNIEKMPNYESRNKHT
jgi:hypothetical protein